MTTNSDPVNSSDEAAVTAFWRAVEYARHAYDLTPYSKMSEDAWPNAVHAAWPIIAAAVRAEAVADERRRIREELHELAQLLPVEEAQRTSTWLARAFGTSALAAGSVPVATPPAEPADDEDETPTGKITRSEAEALRTEAAPSQPVTCEHGEPGRHELTRTDHPLPGCFTTTWCPGPVSVPKESSE